MECGDITVTIVSLLLYMTLVICCFTLEVPIANCCISVVKAKHCIRHQQTRFSSNPQVHVLDRKSLSTEPICRLRTGIKATTGALEETIL